MAASVTIVPPVIARCIEAGGKNWGVRFCAMPTPTIAGSR